MSASRKLRLFFILLFARAVSADGGDDFANNLFSDLAPLLALFGERVTMQFMSASMGWADNIILAMAPIGIITAITVFGTMITLTGFILQFVGLRGLHWSASIAQLGAVFLMICLKAWVRRGLATPPKATPLPSGYELDWFAKTLGKPDQAPWNDNATPDSDLVSESEKLARNSDRKAGASIGAPNSTKCAFEGSANEEWTIASTGGVHIGYWKRLESQGTQQSGEQSERQSLNNSGMTAPMARRIFFPVQKAVSAAEAVLNIRKDLGYLASWRGSASAEAVSLARAIEITMNALIGPLDSFFAESGSTDYDSHDSISLDSASINRTSFDRTSVEPIYQPPSKGQDPPAFTSKDTFYWSLDVTYDGHSHPINFSLRQKSDGKWRAYANEYEAALSLWLSSVNDDKKRTVTHSEETEQTEDAKNEEDDTRLRMEESTRKQGLRLLGAHTPTLRRDLRWWVPNDLARIFEVRESPEHIEDGLLEIENHRIIGYGQPKRTSQQNASSEIEPARDSTRFKRTPLDVPDDVSDSGSDFDENEKETTFATESYSSLPSLFAQHIFSAFMYALGSFELDKDFFQVVTAAQDNSSGGMSWKSFTLHNATLSTMAREIESTGLGSLEDVYLCVIPPLSEQKRLPRVNDAIIGLARKKAIQHEQRGDLSLANDIYKYVFYVAVTSKDQEFIAQATALLVEYLRQLSLMIESGAGKRVVLDNSTSEVHQVHEDLEEWVGYFVDQRILACLMSLYEFQQREWKCTAACSRRPQLSPEEAARYAKAFKIPDIHQKTRLRLNEFDKYYPCKPGTRKLNEKDIHHWTPLHHAASVNGFYPICTLLRWGADINSRDLAERTPLHYACQFAGKHSVVDTLIRAGADINAQGRDGMTPLHCALMESKTDVVSFLIESGANVDIPDTSGNTPLLSAAYGGQLDFVKRLWDVANKRLRDHNGKTALHLAALAGKDDVVEWLTTKQESETNARDHCYLTALHYAASNGHHEVAALLVKDGAEKDARGRDGDTPLHYTAVHGHDGIAALLIEEGAAKDVKGRDDNTPLHYAAMYGHQKVAALLIEEGAEKEAKNEHGETPLDHAARNNHYEVAALLVKGGAEKEARCGYYQTPLLLASERGNMDIVRMLVELNVNVKPQSEDRQYRLTPLQSAAQNGHANIVRILLDSGAKIDTLDTCQKSPLRLAIEEGHTDAAKELIDEGADVNEKMFDIHEFLRFDGDTLLHIAGSHANADLVRLLLENGADKQVKNEPGRTARSAALDVRKILLRKRIHKDEWMPAISRKGIHYTPTLEEFDEVIELLQ
ncbi:hypothetical protein CGLO_08024 [Colletotrichum gloeosporioides Cg-14]|uniref:Uncharacterized protein n=1 Tax=Colletotrichum gloeosporioides (strain Cg-14) TaxID=1237896 RepID=T0LVI8_COLGC|nr:hypothetical protein CGLO_08024 [Colletotrichum gloeosporioides Cg-14]